MCSCRRDAPDATAEDAADAPLVVRNEYHGDVPTFLPVTFGEPASLDAALAGARLSKAALPTLFLCFPPPGVPMAVDAVSESFLSFLNCLIEYCTYLIPILCHMIGSCVDTSRAADSALRTWGSGRASRALLRLSSCSARTLRSKRASRCLTSTPLLGLPSGSDVSTR